MSLPKRNSRPISVEGTRYRWSVSHRIEDGIAADLNSGERYLMIVVEPQDTPGRLLKVALRLTDLDSVVGPRIIAALIRHAVSEQLLPLQSPGVHLLGFDRSVDRYWPFDIGPRGTIDPSKWPKNW